MMLGKKSAVGLFSHGDDIEQFIKAALSLQPDISPLADSQVAPVMRAKRNFAASPLQMKLSFVLVHLVGQVDGMPCIGSHVLSVRSSERYTICAMMLNYESGFVEVGVQIMVSDQCPLFSDNKLSVGGA